MRIFRPWYLGAFLCAVGCGEPTGTAGESSTAGIYLLESVDGCAPGMEAQQCLPRPSWVLDGTMVLSANGRVTRTLSYQLPSDASPVTLVATGTYFRLGDAVVFALWEGAGAAPHVWRPTAVLSDGVLILRYPHPADGETLEVFSRR